jgi:hypothetical protein
MSLIFATQLTAVFTAILGVGAIVTAILAYAAFRKQSREVRAIERQVTDGQELARQQAELLKVQTGQLEVLREQLQDQRKAFAAQTEIVKLQATDLRDSLEERAQEARRRLRAQAQLVFLTEDRYPGGKADPSAPPSVTVTIVNSSNQPIYDADLYWRVGDELYGEPNPEHLGIILPGQSTAKTRKFPSDADLSTCSTELRFNDADGIRFQRRSDGYLENLFSPLREGSLDSVYGAPDWWKRS